nr:BPK_HP1_G0044310.mRNA.1.CDS.1 [Saccharomyces cerevisiae]
MREYNIAAPLNILSFISILFHLSLATTAKLELCLKNQLAITKLNSKRQSSPFREIISADHPIYKPAKGKVLAVCGATMPMGTKNLDHQGPERASAYNRVQCSALAPG